MVRDEEKYKQAVEFRKRGFTYSEIAKICGVSKSTASAWLSKKAFSKRVKADNVKQAARENVKRIGLLNKARATQRKATYADALRSADTEFKHYKTAPLFIAGLMLYVSDGDTRDSSRIRLTTQNADAHRIFSTFLHEYLGVEATQISFWLLLYRGMDEVQEMKWWSAKTKRKAADFGKSQFVASGSKKKPLHHGTGNTIIGSTVLKHKLNRWIELALEELQ
ncbi:MAG: transcriptional regulator with XRE-family HTH domain [Patiriisocius sp.]|jgi:transcriptional regulator with XRE-family HTH domain